MARKIALIVFGLLFCFRVLQAHPWPTLPFWNRQEEKSKKAQKIDAVMNKAIEKRPFKLSWESLKNYQVPDLYRDAKNGMFMHWGTKTLNFCGKADESDGGERLKWKQDMDAQNIEKPSTMPYDCELAFKIGFAK